MNSVRHNQTTWQIVKFNVSAALFLLSFPLALSAATCHMFRSRKYRRTAWASLCFVLIFPLAMSLSGVMGLHAVQLVTLGVIAASGPITFWTIYGTSAWTGWSLKKVGVLCLCLATGLVGLLAYMSANLVRVSEVALHMKYDRFRKRYCLD